MDAKAARAQALHPTMIACSWQESDISHKGRRYRFPAFDYTATIRNTKKNYAEERLHECRLSASCWSWGAVLTSFEKLA